MLRWEEIVSAVKPWRVEGRPIPRIWGVAHDSRRVRPGDAFVAIRGDRHDGHRFLAEAVERGATLAVVERAPGRFAIPLLIVEESRAALPRLSRAFFRAPADELDLTGVTGSMGKTSVSQITAALGAEAGDPIGAIGSLGVQWRFTRADRTSLLTTPESTELQRALRAMADRGQSGAVLEVTSHSLHFGRVDGTNFAHGVVTNLHKGEHADLHPTFDHYVETKHKFADYLRPGASLWVNGDDPLAAAFPAGRAEKFTFGRGDGCDMRAELLSTGPEGTRFHVHLSDRAAERLPGAAAADVESDAWRLSLLSEAQVMNALPALAVSLERGVPVESARETLSRLKPFYRRAEVLHNGEFTVIDEMPHHPAAFDALFDGMIKDWPYRRLHVLYGLRGGRGVDINAANAQRLVRWLRRFPPATFLYTASQGDTHPRDVATDEELDAVRAIFQAGCEESAFCPELETAVAALLDAAGPGDLCLVLGAQGMDRARHYVWQALGRTVAMKA